MSTDSPQMLDSGAVSARATGIRYGGIASLILIVIGLGIHLSGMTDYTDQSSTGNRISNILNYVFIAGALILAMKKHRDDLGGYMTFGKAFSVGIWVVLAMALITGIWTFIFFGLIEPGLTDTILEATRDNMLEQGQSEEQVEQAMGFMRPMMTPVGFTLTVTVFILFIGTIFALIAAAIMQRKPSVNTTY